jgi:hypothetical protein
MFVKYAIKSGVSESDWQKCLYDLRDIMNGTHTSVADFNTDVCNPALSEFTGTLNTSVYVQQSTSSNDFRVDKYHYQRDDANGFAPKTEIRIRWQYSSYPPAIRFGNHNSSNYWPYNSTAHYWMNNQGAGNNSKRIQDYTNFFIWANDEHFIIHAEENGVALQQRGNTAGCFDWEVSDADKFAYNTNNLYSPQLFIFAQDRYLSGSAAQDTGWSQFACGRHTYLANDGSVAGASSWPSSGVNATAEQYASSTSYGLYNISPNPLVNIYSTTTTTGESNYLIPVQAMAYGKTTTTVPTVYGKLTNFYRTTSNLGVTGDTVTIDGTDYAILAMNKGGGAWNTPNANNVDNQCYLIPKL